MLASVRTYGVDALITRGSNTYGPYQYPEKLIPLFTTNLLDGAAACRCTATAARRATSSTSRTTAPGSRPRCARARRARSTTSAAASEIENIETTRRLLELTGRDESLVRHVEDRPGHDRRYALDTASCARSAGRRRVVRARACERTVEWYRESRDWWEPIKRGEGFSAYHARQYDKR